MHQHMTHAIERELEAVAKEISHRYGAPVVIVMGDTKESDVTRVMTAFAGQGEEEAEHAAILGRARRAGNRLTAVLGRGAGLPRPLSERSPHHLVLDRH